MKPLCIDLFCGLGGWTEGFLAAGYNVIGFDIVRRPYPAQLVLQDVATLHGSQFRDAACIVASPPCQAYSYRAMPWSRARALPPPDNSLFEVCFRIQQEACDAAGRYIPLVVENVVGAQKWVGPAKWHYGSYYLWGDVPALMPFAKAVKVSGLNWSGSDKPGYVARAFNTTAELRFRDDIKVQSLDGFCRTKGGTGARFTTRFGWERDTPLRNNSSHSAARKAASALIAKIPFRLAKHIAEVYRPVECAR